jgi:hypothetical protein
MNIVVATKIARRLGMETSPFLRETGANPPQLRCLMDERQGFPLRIASRAQN